MTTRRGLPWTDIDDRELRTLLAAGDSTVRIARKLGRSQSAVMNRKVQLGLRSTG